VSKQFRPKKNNEPAGNAKLNASLLAKTVPELTGLSFRGLRDILGRISAQTNHIGANNAPI
jgi:hypothetical protein